MARTTCLVKIWCMGSYDMIAWCDWCRCDNCVDHHEILKVQVHVIAWWCCDDGVMRSDRINVAGLQSDRTLGYKTRRGFRAVIESLTAQNNTHSTLTLLHSSTMSMINSFQFRTTRGDLISVPRGLRSVRHHIGNSAYLASRLVGLWSYVVVDTFHWPFLDCEQCLAHWSRWKPLDFPHWPGPWWPVFWNEDLGFPLPRTAKGVFDRGEQPIYVRHFELRSLGSRCDGFSRWCCFLGHSLFGRNGWTTLEVDQWEHPAGRGAEVSIWWKLLTLFS